MATLNPEDEATFRVIVVPSDLRSAKRPEEVILDEVHACGFTERAVFGIKLALEEAMTNAVKHGNRGDASKSVTVRYAVTRKKVVIIVKDDGKGFVPDCVPDPTTPARLPLPNGRGIMLMKAYMDDVAYRACGTEVRMVKENRPDPEESET